MAWTWSITADHGQSLPPSNQQLVSLVITNLDSAIVRDISVDEFLTNAPFVLPKMPIGSVDLPDVLQIVFKILPAKYAGYVIAFFTLLGFARAAGKLLCAAFHKYCERTKTPVDDEWLARIENSRTLRTVVFWVDLLLSIKPYRGPATSANSGPTTPANPAPLSTFTKTAVMFMLGAFLFSGCTTQSYSRRNPDGSKVTYRAAGLFNNSNLKGLNVDSTTKETKTGLKLANQENETATEALKAATEAVAEAAVRGAVRAVKP